MGATKVTATDLTTATGQWKLDPARTTVSFRTKAMWVLPVKGSAQAVSGGATVSPDGGVQGDLVVDLKSLSTGMAKRDKHLQTSDFLDTEKYPTLEFVLTGVRGGTASDLTLLGTLRAHGQEQPVELAATASTDGAEATVTATLDDLDRRQWGVTWTKMGAGVHNRVEVKAVFTRVS
jgi:polyisoprenoid-binding protein YceI